MSMKLMEKLSFIKCFFVRSKNGTKEMLGLYGLLDYIMSSIVVEQVALRQLFFYAKYTAENRRIDKNWFSNHVIQHQKYLIINENVFTLIFYANFTHWMFKFIKSNFRSMIGIH